MNSQPTVLSPPQLANFLAKGFLCFNQLFPDASWHKLCSDTEWFLNKSFPQQSGSINGLHTIAPRFIEYAREPALVQRAQQILQSEIYFLSSNFFIKRGGSALFCYWHSDRFLYDSLSLLNPPTFLNVHVAMSLSTAENGGMEVIPGSHHLAPREHDIVPDNNSLFGTRLHRLREPPDLATAQFLELQAGGVSFCHGDLVHRSGPNNSKEDRILLNFRYCPKHVRIDNTLQKEKYGSETKLIEM